MPPDANLVSRVKHVKHHAKIVPLPHAIQGSLGSTVFSSVVQPVQQQLVSLMGCVRRIQNAKKVGGGRIPGLWIIRAIRDALLGARIRCVRLIRGYVNV